MSSKTESFEEYEDMTVTLTLEDDSEIDCSVVTVFDVGGRTYAALLPVTGEDAGSTIYLYRWIESEGEDPRIENIEDDEEYERVSEGFNEYMDRLEEDDLV